MRSVTIDSHQSAVAVHDLNGGVLTGVATISTLGAYRVIAVIRSGSQSGWVRDFTMASPCVGDICAVSGTFNFTLEIRRWIPAGSFTLELSVLPYPGTWSQRFTSARVPFTATIVSSNAVGGELASAVNPSETASAGSAIGTALVALAVVAVIATVVFGSVWRRARQNRASLTTVEPFDRATETDTMAVTSL